MTFDRNMNGFKGHVYKCLQCGQLIRGEKLVERGRIVCPNCGYRVLAKTRPPVVKRIKAI